MDEEKKISKYTVGKEFKDIKELYIYFELFDLFKLFECHFQTFIRKRITNNYVNRDQLVIIHCFSLVVCCLGVGRCLFQIQILPGRLLDKRGH